MVFMKYWCVFISFEIPEEKNKIRSHEPRDVICLSFSILDINPELQLAEFDFENNVRCSL